MFTKILAVYSTVVTTLLAAFTLAGSAAARVQRFDEIDVHRLNVREPDGTLRMVISNRMMIDELLQKLRVTPASHTPHTKTFRDDGQ